MHVLGIQVCGKVSFDTGVETKAMLVVRNRQENQKTNQIEKRTVGGHPGPAIIEEDGMSNYIDIPSKNYKHHSSSFYGRSQYQQETGAGDTICARNIHETQKL